MCEQILQLIKNSKVKGTHRLLRGGGCGEVISASFFGMLDGLVSGNSGTSSKIKYPI